MWLILAKGAAIFTLSVMPYFCDVPCPIHIKFRVEVPSARDTVVLVVDGPEFHATSFDLDDRRKTYDLWYTVHAEGCYTIAATLLRNDQRYTGRAVVGVGGGDCNEFRETSYTYVRQAGIRVVGYPRAQRNRKQRRQGRARQGHRARVDVRGGSRGRSQRRHGHTRQSTSGYGSYARD